MTVQVREAVTENSTQTYQSDSTNSRPERPQKKMSKCMMTELFPQLRQQLTESRT